MVKRYEMDGIDGSENPNGEWVKWDEYEKCRDKMSELVRAIFNGQTPSRAWANELLKEFSE